MIDTTAPKVGNIEMVDVSPRDGLQNEPNIVSTADKIALIERSILSGFRRIEVASFVNSKAVPQMADAEAVCAGLPHHDDVTYIGLMMNQRGAERAIETSRIDQLGAVAVSTDGFAMANQSQTSRGSVEAACSIFKAAKEAGLTAQVTIAASFGCPFEGEVCADHVVAMAYELAKAGAIEIGLADTIGVANPAHVQRLVTRVLNEVAPLPVRVHFHNTRGTGLANVWSAVEAGATVVDASIGGLGGCPFAPGAAGNVPAEDVVYMLERAGIGTGLDLTKLIETNQWLTTVMGKDLPAMVAKAGMFPECVSTRQSSETVA